MFTLKIEKIKVKNLVKKRLNSTDFTVTMTVTLKLLPQAHSHMPILCARYSKTKKKEMC